MQDRSSFKASYDMGSKFENRFCRLAAHCAPSPMYIDEDAWKYISQLRQARQILFTFFES